MIVARLSLAGLFASAVAQETIYTVYIFHRHGDRTPKAFPPANLTILGYGEVLSSGAFYNNRYVDAASPNHIAGLSSTIAKPAQLAVSAPLDTVLQNSAIGFLQGLYPPVGVQTETLANGSTVAAPLGGYQLIPVNLVSTGGGSEDNAWLQDASGCANAKTSSNDYYISDEYWSLLNSSAAFYTRLDPVVSGTFGPADMTYKNAYSIFDVINVARIHNKTISSGELLDPPTVQQLQLLANAHEFGLAYNATDTARAVQGMQLAGEIVQFLNASVSTPQSAPKLGVQFGAYASFLSFFGLAGLPAASANFTGIPDYASSMVFELFGPAPGEAGAVPAASDLSVRFLFANGSAAVVGAPAPFPLFGGGALVLPWANFSAGMTQFAVDTTAAWCRVCGNTTGVCAGTAPGGGAANPASSTAAAGGGKHMSNAVAGVVGAVVALAVVLGLEALVALAAGLRVVRRGVAGKSGSPQIGSSDNGSK